MAKAPKVTAPENKTLGISMNRKANEIAVAINAAIIPELDTLSRHREEWEGGKFAVMNKLANKTSGILTEEQIAELPDPKSDTGNNPARYKVEKFKDGKSSGWKEVYFYKELTQDLPGIRAKVTRIDQLKRSMQDPAKVFTGDIGDDIKNMVDDYRVAQIKRLEKEISNAVGNVTGAFELFFQLQKFEELKHVTYSLVFDLDEQGQPMDGVDGRPFRIAPTQTPIVIKSTVKGREDIDKVQVSVGTFLKYDIDKAVEGHGTYQALMNTVKREKAEDETGNQNAGNVSVPQLVNSPDTTVARIVDVHEYLDRISQEKTKANWEALDKMLHGAGSDEAFMAAFELRQYLERLTGSPRDAVRYESLLQAMNAAEKAA